MSPSTHEDHPDGRKVVRDSDADANANGGASTKRTPYHSWVIDDDRETSKQEGEVGIDDVHQDKRVVGDDEEEARYCRQVYGYLSSYDKDSSSATSSPDMKKISFRRRLSRELSSQLQRRRSSVQESLPTTPQGWIALLTVLGGTMLGYEIRLQQHLTCPPIVYGQGCGVSSNVDNNDDTNSPLTSIYQILTANPESSILLRTIQPSLIVGTRGMLSSMVAYFQSGPPPIVHRDRNTNNNIDTKPTPPPPPPPPPPQQQQNVIETRHVEQFREIMTMTYDGATVALDWEIPASVITKSKVLRGPIDNNCPIVLLVHGINNNSQFGYVRSLMRACTDRKWLAVALNQRGCATGGIDLTTPRGYNGAYTGDLRCVIQRLSARLEAPTNKNPSSSSSSLLFVVGHSLGANLVTKYLGEEGRSGTLPPCVAGGVALGNPMLMTGSKIDRTFSPIMALGVKKTLVQHWKALRPMIQGSDLFRSAIRRALLAVTLADMDEAMASIYVRNEPEYPFTTRIGYDSGEDYWRDASSYRQVPHISIPTLQVVAADDFLIYQPFRGRLRYCLQNPNVMVIETKCGGHLGWQESPPNHNRLLSLGSSWADVVTCDFIDAVLQDRTLKQHTHQTSSSSSHSNLERTLRSRL